MAISHKNGIALTGVSAINGVTSISAINGISATLGGGGGGPVSFSDDFERGGEFPLSGGGNWQATGLGSWSDCFLLSNRALGTNNGSIADGFARVSTSAGSFPSDQSCTITIVSGAYGVYVGPAVRTSSAGAGYFIYHDGSVFHVYKSPDGTSFGAQVGANVSGTQPNTADQLTLEASGTSTVTLTIKLNGSTVGSVTDSSSPLSGGQPGMYVGNGVYVEAMSAASL